MEMNIKEYIKDIEMEYKGIHKRLGTTMVAESYTIAIRDQASKSPLIT